MSGPSACVIVKKLIQAWGDSAVKGFTRKNQLFSLCGLNCGLCTMHLGGHCGGCGNGNQSCKIARCSLEHGGVEYCCECPHYPCEKYETIDEYDSFITHRKRRADMERLRTIGVDRYNAGQEEKVRLLDYLLSSFNDGRRKTLFCLAVNLLELSDVQDTVDQLIEADLSTVKDRAVYAAALLQKAAGEKGISLKLNRKR